MTIVVEVSPEVEAKLSADAGMRGVALEQYVSSLVAAAAMPFASGTGKISREDLRALRSELTHQSANMPVLPPEATDRSSFYEDCV